jgi:glutathione S-transferase
VHLLLHIVVIDYLADGRASFHPVKNTLSYHEQTEEGDRVSKEFAAGRMLKYLAYFHKLVHRAGPHAPVAGGPEVTFADFALFHVLDATVAQFNTEHYDMAWDRLAAPALTEYYTWMGARPNLVAYFASERRFRKLVPQYCLFEHGRCFALPTARLTRFYCLFVCLFDRCSAWAGDSMM